MLRAALPSVVPAARRSRARPTRPKGSPLSRRHPRPRPRRLKEAQRLAKLRRTTTQREADLLEADKAAALKRQHEGWAAPADVPTPAAIVTVV